MRTVTLSLTVLLASASLAARGDEGPPERDEMAENDPAVGLDGTPLYFKLEIRREGRLIAMPQFLGEAGKVLRAERRPPGAAVPDYRLVISPLQDTERRFRLTLDVAVPGLQGTSRLQIDHGEVRKLELGQRKGDLEVKLMLMKVNSPEFRALMRLSAEGARNDTI